MTTSFGSGSDSVGRSPTFVTVNWYVTSVSSTVGLSVE